MDRHLNLEMGMIMQMGMDAMTGAADEQLALPYTAVCLVSSQYGNAINDSHSSGGADSEDSLLSTASGSRCKQVPRQKINARERYRTFNVNAAYEALRGLIPTEPVNRKLSKIEIIRLASSYITHLRSTLHMGTDQNPCLLQRGRGDGCSTHARFNICTFCMKPK